MSNCRNNINRRDKERFFECEIKEKKEIFVDLPPGSNVNNALRRIQNLVAENEIKDITFLLKEGSREEGPREDYIIDEDLICPGINLRLTASKECPLYPFSGMCYANAVDVKTSESIKINPNYDSERLGVGPFALRIISSDSNQGVMVSSSNSDNPNFEVFPYCDLIYYECESDTVIDLKIVKAEKNIVYYDKVIISEDINKGDAFIFASPIKINVVCDVTICLESFELNQVTWNSRGNECSLNTKNLSIEKTVFRDTKLNNFSKNGISRTPTTYLKTETKLKTADYDASFVNEVGRSSIFDVNDGNANFYSLLSLCNEVALRGNNNSKLTTINTTFFRNTNSVELNNFSNGYSENTLYDETQDFALCVNNNSKASIKEVTIMGENVNINDPKIKATNLSIIAVDNILVQSQADLTAEIDGVIMELNDSTILNEQINLTSAILDGQTI